MSDGFRRREDERTPMTKDELKRRVWEAVDRRREEIIGLGEQIRRHPELGFKEVKTARLVEETFKKLGLAPRSGLALTGDRKSTRLNSSHLVISYAVFCLKKKSFPLSARPSADFFYRRFRLRL